MSDRARTKLYTILLLSWGCLVLAGLVQPRALVAAQGTSPITIDVQAGYDGAYRFAEWFPVIVNIANDGPDLRAMLQWSFPGQRDEITFHRTIDLPRGSRKRVQLDVFSRDFARNGRLRLFDGSTQLLEQTVALEAVDQSRFMIGVISSDPALLNSLEALTLAAASGTTVRHLETSTLPEHPAALRGMDALFLHDLDSTAFSPAQLDAMKQWITLGGQVIVSGGIAAQRTSAALTGLLPVELTGNVNQGDLTPLARLAGPALPPQSATAALSEARPHAGTEQLPADTGLIFRGKVGVGSVIFTAFDLASLRGWTGETALWERVLTPVNAFAPGTDARQHHNNPLQDVLLLPALNLPSTSAVLCFLVAYIVALGPLNYLVLRWMRRLDWAWLTVPLAVLLFAGGLYVVGFVLRGGRAQLNQVAVVQGTEGETRGLATTFVGLFSPRRASYTIAFPADTLISEVYGWRDTPTQAVQVTSSDSQVEVADVLIDVGSVRTFMAEHTLDLPLSIQSSIREQNGAWEGEIRNTGNSALEDVLIVRGGTFQHIGTLAPGASQPVSSANASNNFPWGVNLAQSGLFNRQQLLSSLFNNRSLRFRDPNAPSLDAIDDDNIYLLAWVNQPTVAVRVNGQEQEQNVLTLYVMRLQS